MTSHSTGRTFTPDDMQRLAGYAAEIRQFEEFVLRRFADCTITTHVRDTSGCLIDSVVLDTFPRTDGGFGVWQVSQRGGGLFPNGDHVVIEHYLSNDRGPGHVTTTVRLPLSFVFGDPGREARYQEYLALKDEFEPGN